MADSLHNCEVEEWRDIPGWEGLYAASSLGRIKSLRRTCLARGGAQRLVAERIMSPARRGRYEKVNLSSPNGNKTAFVHRLVCSAFWGEPSDTHPEVAHWDGDSQNNRADNLRWTDRLGNAADKIRHGTYRTGVAAKGKLAHGDIREIRNKARKLYAELAEAYGVRPDQIEKVVLHKAWRDIA